MHGVFAPDIGFEKTRAAIKNHLATLLHCRTDELALVHHTTEGILFISHGLALDRGDEILLLENEYPSNVYPWEHWREKGVRLRFVQCRLHPDDFLSEFSEAVRPSVKVASMSLVHWCTGMPLPIPEIGRICRKHGIFLCVDGAQGIGHIPIRLADTDIDAMAFPAWKWLLGPLGLGILYIRNDVLPALRFPFKGTDSVRDSGPSLPYKDELKNTADRYTLSTPNFADWIYFSASLSFLADIGWDNVRNRLAFLGRYLAEKLRQAGFSLLNDRFSESASSIIVADGGHLDSGALVRRLRENHIIVADRAGNLRFSPHIHIAPNDIDQAVSILRKICDL